MTTTLIQDVEKLAGDIQYKLLYTNGLSALELKLVLATLKKIINLHKKESDEK